MDTISTNLHDGFNGEGQPKNPVMDSDYFWHGGNYDPAEHVVEVTIEPEPVEPDPVVEVAVEPELAPELGSDEERGVVARVNEETGEMEPTAHGLTLAAALEIVPEPQVVVDIPVPENTVVEAVEAEAPKKAPAGRPRGRKQA